MAFYGTQAYSRKGGVQCLSSAMTSLQSGMRVSNPSSPSIVDALADGLVSSYGTTHIIPPAAISNIQVLVRPSFRKFSKGGRSEQV